MHHSALSSECIDHGYVGDKDGYASTSTHEFKDSRKVVKLHRLVYCKFNNLHINALDGLVVMHLCDNTRCINPKHLKAVKQSNNVADMVLKDRSAKGIHPGKIKLTPAQADYIRDNYKPRCKVNGATALSRKFNVHFTTIVRIANGTRLTHKV